MRTKSSTVHCVSMFVALCLAGCGGPPSSPPQSKPNDAKGTDQPARAEEKTAKVEPKTPMEVTPKDEGKTSKILPAEKPIVSEKSKVSEKPKAVDEEPEPRAKALPAGVVDAWKKAGFWEDWFFGENSEGEWVGDSFGRQGILPLFRPAIGSNLKPGVIASLPPPTTPFGLNLTGQFLTPALLKEVAALKNLSALNLSSTFAKDADLEPLAALGELTRLNLTSCDISGAGIKKLAGLKKLRTLNLYLTSIKPADLKEAGGFAELETLYLGGVERRIEGTGHLAVFKRLKNLHMPFSPVPNDSLDGLLTLNSLRVLGLQNARFNGEALDRLRKARPNLVVLQ